MPQYVNKSEETVNIGRFAPQVNYSQIEPRKENYRLPQPSVYDDTDRLANFASSFSKAYASSEKKKEEKDDKDIRNQMAKDFNLVAERQRQGQLSSSAAENEYRRITNNYVAAGVDEKTISEVRGRNSWGIISNEEARQKKLMENEVTRRKAYIDDLAANNPVFRGKSYEYIEDVLAQANSTYDTAKIYQDRNKQLAPESPEYRANHSQMMDAAVLNADVRLNMLVQEAQIAGQPINNEFIQAARVNLQRSLSDPNGLGLSYDEAVAVSERAINNTPYAQMANDTDAAYKYSTETYKLITDNNKAGAEYQVYKDPRMAALLAAGGQPMQQEITNQIQSNQKPALAEVADNFINGVALRAEQITPDIVSELPTLIKSDENAVRVNGAATDFMKGSIGARVLEVYNGANSFDINNYSQQDLDNIANNYKMLENRGYIASSEKNINDGLKSDDEKIREQWQAKADALNKTKGTVVAANLLNPNRNAKATAMMRLTGTAARERLRYNPETQEVYLEAPEGFVQNAGEFFNKINFSETEYNRAVSDLNKSLSNYDSDVRGEALKALGIQEGRINTGEENTKDYSRALDILPAVGSITNISRAIKSIIERNNGKVSDEEMKEIDAAVAAGKAEMATPVDPNVAKLQDLLEEGDLKPNVRRAVEGTIEKLTSRATMKSSETLANAAIRGYDILRDPKLKWINENVVQVPLVYPKEKLNQLKEYLREHGDEVQIIVDNPKAQKEVDRLEKEIEALQEELNKADETYTEDHLNDIHRKIEVLRKQQQEAEKGIYVR